MQTVQNPFTPLPQNEDERLAALRSYSILDTVEEKDFDELTLLASEICQTPIALISLIDAERQWFKSHIGTDETESQKEHSFCAHAIASSEDIMVIDDATQDQRFFDNPLVTCETGIVFYAGVPLINEDGFALGSLCVIDHERKKFSEGQANALKILAKQVVGKLELRRKIKSLEIANQELRDANVFIQKFASMAAHDIKNPLSSIMLTSQALKIRLQKLEDEGCIRMVDLNIASTNRLSVLIDEMQAYSQNPSLLVTKKQNVEFTNLLKRIITLINLPEGFTINIPDEQLRLSISVVTFEQIFINLLSNAIRYNDKKNGMVTIRFAQDDDYYRFEVEDNGIGIAQEYHEKIFGINFTLKIADRYNKKGTGIGLSTVKDLVKALKGTIYIKSIPGEGSTFFIAVKK